MASFLAKAVGVGFAAAVVAALHRVLDEAVEGVIVDLAAAGGIDAALGSDGVGTTGGVVVGEGLYVVAEFAEGGGSTGAGQTGTHNDDGELATVEGADEVEVCHRFIPGHRGGACRHMAVKHITNGDARDDGGGCHKVLCSRGRIGSSHCLRLLIFFSLESFGDPHGAVPETYGCTSR